MMTSVKTTATRKKYLNLRAAALAMLATTLLASGVALAAATTFSNSTPIKIADAVPPNRGLADAYPSEISVQNLSEPVRDVNLKLSGYTHGWPDDVGVLLEGPQGQKALLMSDAGSRDDVSNVNLTLDDEATTSLPDDAQITSGTYRPIQGAIRSAPDDCFAPAHFPSPAPAGPYATNLSVFDGTDPNGTWKLYIIDDCPTDEGQFAGGWSLEISTDSTSPRVNSTTPLRGAIGVSPRANIKATFSEDMNGSTINATTFKLFERGSTTEVGATVSYDAATDSATLDPATTLKRGVTYNAVVTTEAKDLADNRLDQNSSLSGLQQKVWSFKVKN